jgi:tetratricopeptide (TPR) repeat protein/TolB-like protein
LAPDDERARRRLIELLDAAGDRAGALRAYDDFAKWLATEFDSTPSTETRATADRIRVRTGDSRRAYSAPPLLSGSQEATVGLAELPAAQRGVPSRRASAIGKSVALVIAATVLAASGWAVTRRWREPSGPRSIAVLPCRASVDDISKRYLGESLTGELIERVSMSRLFDKVIAATSVSTYRDTPKRPSEIGAELGAGALLYCDYRQTGSRENARIELVQTRTGSVLWASSHEHEVTAAASEPLASVLVDRLAVMLNGANSGRREAPHGATTKDIRALNRYREGQHFLSQMREDAVQRSVVLFREASALDTNYALPYVGLGRAYLYQGIGHGTMREREAFPLVKEAATRALDLDPANAEAHMLLALYDLFFGWDYARAEQRLRHAILLDPTAAYFHEMLGIVLAMAGRHAEARLEGARATELDPVNPLLWADAGVVRFIAGEYEAGIPFVEKSLDLSPEFYPSHWILGALYAEMGRLPLALDHLRRADSLSGHMTAFRGWLGYGLALDGHRDEAQAIVEELKRNAAVARSPGKTATMIGIVYIGLNERDSAFAWLENAYDHRSSLLSTIMAGPGRRLALDPRHSALVSKLGLSPSVYGLMEPDANRRD